MTRLRSLLILLHDQHGQSLYALAKYLNLPYRTLHRWYSDPDADAASSRVEATIARLLLHPALALVV